MPNSGRPREVPRAEPAKASFSRRPGAKPEAFPLRELFPTPFFLFTREKRLQQKESKDTRGGRAA